MRCFVDARARALPQRITELVRARHADAVAELTAEELDHLVRTGIARSRAYGFTMDGDAYWFVVMMITVSERFDEVPFIAQSLGRTDATPSKRIDLLLTWSTAADWEEASRR